MSANASELVTPSAPVKPTRKASRPKRPPTAVPDGPTHVALEVRLTLAEARALEYWLGRLETMLERGVCNPEKGSGIDLSESLDAVRKTADRVADAQPAEERAA